MSESAAQFAERLNYADILARIERQREEASKLDAERNKLIVEQSKLAAEQNKLVAEAIKLSAESDKLRRDRSLAPILAAIAFGGLLATLAGVAGSLLPAILRTATGH